MTSWSSGASPLVVFLVTCHSEAINGFLGDQYVTKLLHRHKIPSSYQATNTRLADTQHLGSLGDLV
jgi:hypothetical protein